MKGLIKKAFTDKYTTQYYEPGQVIEFADARAKELSAMGFVEIRDDSKVKPAKAVAKPKKTKK